jgi:hypothetical protein
LEHQGHPAQEKAGQQRAQKPAKAANGSEHQKSEQASRAEPNHTTSKTDRKKRHRQAIRQVDAKAKSACCSKDGKACCKSGHKH